MPERSVDAGCDRRGFLGSMGLGALAGTLAPQALGSAVAAPGDAPTTAASAPCPAPADLPRDLPAEATNLGTLFPEVERLAKRLAFRDRLEPGKFASYDEYRTKAREFVLRTLQYDPEPVDPRPEVLDRADCGSYVREKIVFSTTPDFRVPAYVLVPKGLKEPAPAIVDLHSHGGMFLFGKEKVIDFGTNHPTMTVYHQRNYDGRPTATALVQRGYVVISIDAFLFGERRVLLEEDRKLGWDRAKYGPDEVQALNQKCRAKEATLVKSLIFAGLTWPGIVVRDDMRTIDYLCTRPEVDAKRIGCLGISMGGYRTLLLAGLDDRIRAACVTGFLSTVLPMIRRHVDTHSWVHFLPEVHRGLDWPDVVALRAPLPLLVQQCRQDGLFPLAGMEAAVESIAGHYRRAGRPESFSGRFYDEPHRFSRAMQDEAFAWLDGQLKKV